jgi:hypothetical protein
MINFVIYVRIYKFRESLLYNIFLDGKDIPWEIKINWTIW